MWNVKFLCSIVFFVLSGYVSFAIAKDATTVLSEDKRVEHIVGEKRGDISTPGLREYGFWERKTRYGSVNGEDDVLYNSSIYAWYETSDIRNVEDYAFVLYRTGCSFISALDASGKEVQGLGVTRQHFGKRIVFVHPKSEIDSDDTSPMYGSSDNQPLLPHYFMEWGVAPNKFPDRLEKLYGEDPPALPRLYVRAGSGSPAHIENPDRDTAVNHSFRFRMCLYRTKDILREVDKQTFIADPIDCFSWSSSFIYNHQEKKFESPPGIAPVCRPEVIPSPEKRWEMK